MGNISLDYYQNVRYCLLMLKYTGIELGYQIKTFMDLFKYYTRVSFETSPIA